ncbi:MAG: SsrA-binding protein SmpB [Verrucomicrobiota bacterium]
MGDVEIHNRKASHYYKILETFEAGIELQGTEVKSLRGGHGHLNDAFARVEKGEVWLYNFDIAPYSHGNRENHEPKRTRKLLLHKQEIRRLFGEISRAGRTLVPLKGYFKKRCFKLLLGVGVGKTQHDKRQSIMKRDTDRQIRRALSSRRHSQ